MVNWYAVGLAAALAYILPKRYIAYKILNFYKYRSLNAPPPTAIVILDDVGMNYEKARTYARRGARVIIGGQNRLKLASAKKELMSLTKNKNISCKHVNKHDRNSLKSFAEEIMNEVVKIDAMVNNNGRELADLEIIFKTQQLAKERFENHCLNFLYVSLPDDL